MFIAYAVKELRLSIAKTIRLNGPANAVPSSFTIGRHYSIYRDSIIVFTSKAYMSGACIRDVTLNGEYFFSKEIFVNANIENDIDRGVKYGCDFLTNECPTSNNIKEKSPTCLNNSTCVYKLYNYECVECHLPFYGKNCDHGKKFN